MIWSTKPLLATVLPSRFHRFNAKGPSHVEVRSPAALARNCKLKLVLVLLFLRIPLRQNVMVHGCSRPSPLTHILCWFNCAPHPGTAVGNINRRASVTALLGDGLQSKQLSKKHSQNQNQDVKSKSMPTMRTSPKALSVGEDVSDQEYRPLTKQPSSSRYPLLFSGCMQTVL